MPDSTWPRDRVTTAAELAAELAYGALDGTWAARSAGTGAVLSGGTLSGTVRIGS